MSAEAFADVGGGIRLCYEEHGAPGDPLVLLVMGLGLDLSWWKDDLVAQLVARGLRVVRFDNRDVGRSTRLEGPGVSALGFLRRRATPTYTLEEMGADAAGLVRALEPAGGGAHVVGASLGSLIAQAAAIGHPEEIRSLTSIMGRPGDGRTGKVARRMLLEFLRGAPSDPVEGIVRTFHRIGSDGRTAQDDEDTRHAFLAQARRERGAGGDGSGRQLAAILTEADRTSGLQGLRMPAFVLHGTRDRIILPTGGRATAAAILDAELLELPGMGHDLPRWVWPHLADGIARTVSRAA